MSGRGCRMGGRVCRGWFGRRARLGWGSGSPFLIDLDFFDIELARRYKEITCLRSGWGRSRVRLRDGREGEHLDGYSIVYSTHVCCARPLQI
jgi:hypothetical protein